MTRIFISSTSKDLFEYRKALMDALLQAGFDLSAMEHFGAQSGDAAQVSEAELVKSDVMVGVYALRYGYVPEGSSISVTEMEYNWAKEHNKPRLCFVLDPTFQDFTSPLWTEQDPAMRGKLEAFKSRIGKELVVTKFTTAESLTITAVSSLTRWVQSGAKEKNESPAPVINNTFNVENNKGVIVGNISGGTNTLSTTSQ